MSAPPYSYNRAVRELIRALIVLHRAFHTRDPRTRVHVLVRFLTCPFLRVVRRVPPGARVLDVGAGHGVFSALAADRGAHVVAVEPDFRKVLPVPGVQFVIGFDDVVRGTFDVVAINDVLYKVPIDQWDALLARALERLPPGGMLFVKEQDPSARIKNAWNRWQESIATKLRLTLGESFSYETPADFTARLQRLGFRDVEARRIDFGYPHSHILYVAKK
jgi:2-polyprenyl-3-methyl-5-hydroxy-6-metoxy-1,4-benzoquinol methylase